MSTRPVAEPELVVEPPSECQATVVHEIAFPPFQLSIDEARQVSSAILVVWVVAWGIRMVIKTMTAASEGPRDE